MRPPRRDALSGPRYSLPAGVGRHRVRLDHNENNFGCSPAALDAVRLADQARLSTYPIYQEFVERLARHLGVTPAMVMPANGSDDAIRSIMEAWLEPGDRVVLPVPTFAMFSVLARLRGAELLEVPYAPDLSFPLERVLAAIDGRTAMVILVNPNSPTGTMLPRSALLEVLEKAANAIVVLDEAYCHYSGRSDLDLVASHDNLVVLQTFSKAHGLAGMRLGYVASCTGNIETLRAVTLPYAVNGLALVAAAAALADRDHLANVVERTRREMEFLATRLDAMGWPTRISHANFVLPRLGPDASRLAGLLAREGILVKDLSGLPLMDGLLRITAGTHEQNLELLDALRRLARPEAILFDLDGVLVDVSGSYREAIRGTVESFSGAPVAAEEVDSWKQKGGFNNDWDTAHAIVRGRGIPVAREEIVARFQELYLGRSWDGLVSAEKWLLDPALLARLSSKYRLGIVTGRPRDEAEHVLARFGVRDRFAAVVTLDDTPPGKSKPDPWGIASAMGLLDVRRAVYVGDAVDDMRAARAAGIRAVGVASADPARTRLVEAGADSLVAGVHLLEEVLQ